MAFPHDGFFVFAPVAGRQTHLSEYSGEIEVSYMVPSIDGLHQEEHRRN